MKLINNNMKLVMILSGALTFTMVFAAIAPQEALNSMFGVNLKGPLAEVVVRNWGALIALIGGMLIYGAFNIAVRQLVLIVAVLSKAIFIALVITNGFGEKLTITISFDAVLIIIFSTYLYSTKNEINFS